MAPSLQPAGMRQLVPFAGLSATYFAHIGFFNPYLPLWLKAQGLPVVVALNMTDLARARGIHVDAEVSGQARTHRGSMRTDLRTLADHRDVGIAHTPPAPAQRPRRRCVKWRIDKLPS